MFSEIWDYICDFFSYLISFEWFFDLKDGIGEFFSDSSDWFSSDSPVASIWFWVFYAIFLFGIWVMPSTLGLADYKLWEKIVGSVVFFVLDFIVVAKFKS